MAIICTSENYIEKGKLVTSQHQGRCSLHKQRWLNVQEDNSVAADAWKYSPGCLVGKSPGPEHVCHVGRCGPCAPLRVAEASFASSRACHHWCCWLSPGKPHCKPTWVWCWNLPTNNFLGAQTSAVTLLQSTGWETTSSAQKYSRSKD